MRNPKRILLIPLVFSFALIPVWSTGSFSVGVGGNFFLNEESYLDAFSTSYEHELQEGLELNLGVDLAINRANKNTEGETVASFLVPVSVGLNFIFPNEVVTFVFGAGISPVFNFNPETETDFQFFGGPYVKGALRVRVHPVMNWFISGQQDLQLGGDNIINGSTRVLTGINFAVQGNNPGRSLDG